MKKEPEDWSQVAMFKPFQDMMRDLHKDKFFITMASLDEQCEIIWLEAYRLGKQSVDRSGSE